MPAYQLRIHLRGISPPVWRRILIDAEASIADLHDVIQRSIGWADDHLNQFVIRGRRYSIPKIGACSYGDASVKLSAFGFRIHERFVYEYDFYSEWVHDIRVEKIVERLSKRQHRLPLCLAGVGGCPPEDSGPPARFMDALDEHSAFGFMRWLAEQKEEHPGRDAADFYQELMAWKPWILCNHGRFDRKSANCRLQEREVES